MKIELSIHENYCDGWGLYEASREFAQNGRDAVKTGCSFDMVHEPAKNILKFITKGAVLSHKTLLLGLSDKSGQINMLGKWGEGYKIASLALLRMGKRIRIRTGSELWEPEVAYSKKFGENVLTFNITGSKTMRNETIVELLGVSEDEWKSIAHRFLFLGEHNYDIEHSSLGNVLLHQKGQIFVDGIYVCTNEYLEHGYDFQPAQLPLDRDRRVVNYWDVQRLTAKAWEHLYLADKHQDIVDKMLAENSGDVQHFKYDYVVTQALHRKIADNFVKKHGEAVPVKSLSEVKELEHYQKRGEIVAAESLRSILEQQLGTVGTVKLENVTHYNKTHPLTELTVEQAHNLLAAQKLVNDVIGNNFPPYEVVTFVKEDIFGMRKDDKIYLSVAILNSFSETLKTIVEEVAHEYGGHDSHAFTERLHQIYCAIVVKQLGNQPIIRHPSTMTEMVF